MGHHTGELILNWIITECIPRINIRVNNDDYFKVAVKNYRFAEHMQTLIGCMGCVKLIAVIP